MPGAGPMPMQRTNSTTEPMVGAAPSAAPGGAPPGVAGGPPQPGAGVDPARKQSTFAQSPFAKFMPPGGPNRPGK
jgi:hypothetical protein